MARTWGLLLIRRSLGSLAATLALVFVVFLAERMTGFVEMLVARGAPIGDLPWVLLLTAPEIVVTAMPIAVLIGVHRALKDARDGGETVAMAGAGVGPWGLLSALLGVGVVMVALVVAIAGFVDPLSRAARDGLFLEAAHRMAVDAIRDGLPSNRIETLGGYTFVSPHVGAAGRPLLVFLPPVAGIDRIVSAGSYELVAIEESHRFHLQLHDVVVSDLAPPTGQGKPAAVGSGYRLGSLARDVDLDEPLRDPVLADQPQYRDLVALIRAGASAAGADLARRAAEILARSWLAVAAVLVAAIAVSFSNGRRRFFALPIAGAVMVVLDIALVRAVRAFGGVSPLSDLGHAAAAVAVLLIGLAAVLKWRWSAVVAPPGGRA